MAQRTVAGGVADNAADSEDPIKVGGIYNSADQTYAGGDRANLQMDVNGRVLTADVNSSSVTVFSSAARTSTTNATALTNRYGKGVRLYLDVSAASGTSPTLDVTIQTQDAISATWIALPGAAFGQKTGVSFDDLTIYPGVAETANETVSDHLGTTWRAVATIGGTSPSFTPSLGAVYLR